MLDINFTLLIQVANFIILMFLLNFLLFKPLLSFVEKRKSMVEGTLSEAREEEERAEEILERYHQVLTDARRAADARYGEAQASAEDDRRQRMAEAGRRADEAVGEAAEEIRQTAQEVRQGLKDQARSLAESIAEKVLGRPV